MKLISQFGTPELQYGNNRSSYRDYIKFDNINRIFYSDRMKGRTGLELIRIIYESLNSLLSNDPNYMHQRAKCYIKSAQYEGNSTYKSDYLKKAYRDANVSSQVFELRYQKSGNMKLLISYAHVTYTMALVLCHICYNNKYAFVEENSTAIMKLYQALESPYNSYDIAKSDPFNYQNVIKQTVVACISNPEIVDESSREYLPKLLWMISDH